MTPYIIQVRVYQKDTDVYFLNVERANWEYGGGSIWSECNGLLTLTMGESGTSGMLRFQTEAGKEALFVALGIHNYEPWLDVVIGLGPEITCVKALPEYYNGGPRAESREACKKSVDILNAEGRRVAVQFEKSDGQNLLANFTLGG